MLMDKMLSFVTALNTSGLKTSGLKTSGFCPILRLHGRRSFCVATESRATCDVNSLSRGVIGKK